MYSRIKLWIISILLISFFKYTRSFRSMKKNLSINARDLLNNSINKSIDQQINRNISSDQNFSFNKKSGQSIFEQLKSTNKIDQNFNELIEDKSIESKSDIKDKFDQKFKETSSKTDQLNLNENNYPFSNVSYTYLPIKYLNSFQSIIHSNIPSRVPIDRSQNRKPLDKSKHSGHYNEHQFHTRQYTDTLNNLSSSIPQEIANFLYKKKQSKESHSLSNNISNILEQLLKGYDKNERPDTQGGKTVVTTNIHIRSMGPMSETLMEYSLDCYFRQKWYDPRLKYKGSFQSLTLNIHMLSLIWTPDTFFMNGKGSYVHEITRPNKFLRIYQDGQVYYSMRLTVKATCFMELKNFPMDKQSCPLMFGSYGYLDNELEIIWDDNEPVSLANDLVMSQFDLISYPCRNGTRLFREGYYSMLQVNFNFIRHTGYFLIQIYFPCGLIVVISWVSFWINRENTADRVGLGITSVLTLSTFGLEVSQSGPKVSYPTALNWFMIICFIYANATLIQFSFVHYFTKIGSGELTFYFQQLKTKEKNKEKAKLHKLNKLKEKIQKIDEQTKNLKEIDQIDYIDPIMNHTINNYSHQTTNHYKDQQTNLNELSLSELTTSYDDSNDDLILNNTSFEDEEKINNSELDERDKEIELQMLDIKRILNVVELNKCRTETLINNSAIRNESQNVDKVKLKRRSKAGQTDHLKSMQNESIDNSTHYLDKNNNSLDNEMSNKFKSNEDQHQQFYCPKHDRWFFSSSISMSFDDQTDQFSEDVQSIHEQQQINSNENSTLNNRINRLNSKQWTINTNQQSIDQSIKFTKIDQMKQKTKKNKIYRNSLDHQLPFTRWNKIYTIQNSNPLNAFNLNDINHFNPINLPFDVQNSFKSNANLSLFKKQKNEENKNSIDSFNATHYGQRSESNQARKRKVDKFSQKTKDKESYELNTELNQEQDPLSLINKLSDESNERKEYWFENIRLPKLILQFITCIIASEDYRDHITRHIDEDDHINSVSKVDTISKFLFPSSFIIVNIIYWLFYYTERSSGFEPISNQAEIYQII